MLSTVKLYLGSARGNLVLTPESARLFSRSIEHLDSSIQEMRRVARDLMPEALLTFGLPAAVRDLCETLQHGQPPLRVQCEVFGLEEPLAERLPQRTELVVYRLVQELLNNVLKHARAGQVIVQLTRLRDGTRRVTHVTEVQGMEGDIVTLQDAFVFDYSAGVDEAGRLLGHAVATGVRPRFADKFRDLGIPLSPSVFQANLVTRSQR